MPKRKPQNAMIEVILLESDKHLGEKYEIVRVKPSFARNVLIPKNKVVLATVANKHNYQKKLEAAQKEIAQKAQDMRDLFAKIQENNGLRFVVRANEEGGLYAKIDENDLAQKITQEYGVKVPEHLFKLKKKISHIGSYKVPFVYKDMKAEVLVVVSAEEPVQSTVETPNPETSQ